MSTEKQRFAERKNILWKGKEANWNLSEGVHSWWDWCGSQKQLFYELCKSPCLNHTFFFKRKSKPAPILLLFGNKQSSVHQYHQHWVSQLRGWHPSFICRWRRRGSVSNWREEARNIGGERLGLPIRNLPSGPWLSLRNKARWEVQSLLCSHWDMSCLLLASTFPHLACLIPFIRASLSFFFSKSCLTSDIAFPNRMWTSLAKKFLMLLL